MSNPQATPTELNDAVSAYSAVFAAAVSRVLADEGGLVDDPADAGEVTKYGISQRQYPELNIAALSRQQAAEIYYRDWSQRFDYATLPPAIGIKVMDLAVNMGPAAAARCLQRALRACGKAIADDGELGAVTRAAVKAVEPATLLVALRSEAAGRYRVIAALRAGDEAERDHFLTGWLNRAYE
jgi:lysozyme family protein